MITSMLRNTSCSMMEEQGLQRYLQDLQRNTPVNDSPIPTISPRTLECFDRRARELRSREWVEGVRHLRRWLGGAVSFAWRRGGYSGAPQPTHRTRLPCAG